MTPPPTDTLNLLIGGAARSGTTSLMHVLSEHPEIAFCVSPRGHETAAGRIELPFHQPAIIASRAGREPSCYHRFSGVWAGKVAYIAMKGTHLLYYPHIAFNIAAQLPNARMIFCLRNPIDVIWSLYWNDRKRARERGDDGGAEDPEAAIHDGRPERTFREYVALSESAARETSSFDRVFGWPRLLSTPWSAAFNLDRGFYAEHLERYFRVLARERIHVLAFDDLVRDPRRCLAAILEFLELDAGFSFTTADAHLNEAPRDAEMDPDVREQLRRLYAPSNERLFEMLGWTHLDWR